MTTTTTTNTLTTNPKNTLYLNLNNKHITIELMPNLTPKHITHIKKLTHENFYNDIIFHHMIKNFITQTNNPTNTNINNSNKPNLKTKFNNYIYKHNTLNITHTNNPNTTNNQFFIYFDNNNYTFLTNQYTIFKQITQKIKIINNITHDEPPTNPSKIMKATITTDETKATKTN